MSEDAFLDLAYADNERLCGRLAEVCAERDALRAQVAALTARGEDGLRELTHLPWSIKASAIAQAVIREQTDPLQPYVTAEECLAYGDRILRAALTSTDRT